MTETGAGRGVRRFVASLLAVVLLASGCGGDDGTADTSAAATTAPPTTPATTTAAPEEAPTTAPSTTAVPVETTTTTAAAGMARSATYERISAAGVIRIGVRDRDLAPLSVADGAGYSGFEPELATEVVMRLFDGVEIEWVPVATPERFDVVVAGEVDLVFRSTTITPERSELVGFTIPYLLDGPALMVPAAAGATTLADLDSALIALQAGTTSEAQLAAALDGAGLSYEAVPVGEGEQPPDLVDSGQADAYLSSVTGGLLEMTRSGGLVMIPVEFSERIAAFGSLDGVDFLEEVSDALRAVVEDGTWDALFMSTFGSPAPWSTGDMVGSS